MQVSIQAKLKAMLWDLPENMRSDLSKKILTDPFHVFLNDEQLLLKALSSLKWHELTRLVNEHNLLILLTDSTIQKLHPVQRRTYYTNARRLLSKYIIPPTGQST